MTNLLTKITVILLVVFAFGVLPIKRVTSNVTVSFETAC